MRITSFNFFIFLLLSLVVYYLFPKKHRWIVLLTFSSLFLLAASSWKLLLYLVFGIITTYIGTNLIHSKIKSEKSKKIVLFLTLISIVGELFLLKYINIFPMTANLFGDIFNIDLSFKTFNLVAPLGISYYTLSLIGYVIDVYRGTTNPQKNIFKHALFASYYPVLISGPIVRYPQMEKELFTPRSIEWSNIFQGFQRIIYGLLKKMVLADQLAIIVGVILKDYQTYSGPFIIIAVIFYAIQIYADFSGCMDIVIGASKMYGIVLPENFDSPFFSKNLSEFWRRWHISLGSWAKDYIMYPLLKSNFFQKIGKQCKKTFGKKIGKTIPTIISILILWLLIGLWHGSSYKYIFAAGILPWIYLTLGQIFENPIKKLNQKLNINTERFSFRLFQSLRTFALMCIIWFFAFAPTLTSSISLFKNIFIINNDTFSLLINLSSISMIPILFVLLTILIVDYLNYKKINVLEKFNEQSTIFRWIVLFIFIIVILIYGAYGSGYNAVDFIYGGF